MTKDEVFAQLRQAFGLDSILKRYESLQPLDGLAEAVRYWDWAKDVQERAASDRAWWEYENEKTLAYVLMGVFCWQVLGHDDFTPLADASPDVLMDKHAHLCLWSRCLILDHVHRWEDCRHDARTNSPSHPKCRVTGQTASGGLYHPICGICGEERYDPQPMLDRAHRMMKDTGPTP